MTAFGSRGGFEFINCSNDSDCRFGGMPDKCHQRIKWVEQSANLCSHYFHTGFQAVGALNAIDVYCHMPVPNSRYCQSDG